MATDSPARVLHAEGPRPVEPEAPVAEARPSRGRRWRRRRAFGRVLLVLGPLVVAVGAAVAYYAGGRYVETENAYVKADTVMIAAEVSGPIEAVAVRENQYVAAGDVLFRIDDRTYRIALARAEAQLAAARGEIARLKAVHRQKQAEMAVARTNVAFAEKEFKRQSRLVASSAVSRSKYDATRHDLDVARQHIAVLRQEAAQILAELDGDPDMAVEAHSLYLEAKAARDQAALDLEHTVVRAPFAGIASKTPQVGRQVTGNGPMATPVMGIVAARGAWIEANFKETEITHLRPGQAATVRVDTYPDRTWRGTVESISQATGAEFSVIPPQNATGNWVKVVQRVPVRVAVEADPDDPMLRAGMSAVVEIDTGHKRPLPGVLAAALSWVGLSWTGLSPEARAADPR